MERLGGFFLVLLFVMASSCSYNKNFIGQKHYSVVQESYQPNDTIYLKDFTVYSTSMYRDYRLKVEHHGDSLFNVFKSGINKLNLNLRNVEGGRNYAQLSFFSDAHLSYQKINRSLIFKSASQFPDKTIIFPVILNYHRLFKDFDRSSHHFPKFGYYLTLAVFIVKNKEVLYFKQTRHFVLVNHRDHPFKFEDFHIPIPQEKWDELVKEVMHEYIERLK